MAFIELGTVGILGLVIGFLTTKFLIKTKKLSGTITDIEKINEYLYKIKLKTPNGKIVETLIFSKYSINRGLRVLLERKEEEIFVIKKVSI
jgi:hypothetical protein